MNYSFKRYWEPSIPQYMGLSLGIGAVTTVLPQLQKLFFFGSLFLYQNFRKQLQPIEFIKILIQQRAEGIGIRQLHHYAGYNPHKIFRDWHATGRGFMGFYVGIESALMSRLSYLTVRNFVYKVIYNRVKPVKPTNDLMWTEKAWLGAFAGALGALVSQPFEMIMVRQITDHGVHPKENRRGYTGGLSALSHEMTKGGVISLYKGFTPYLAKIVALNISLTGPYDYIKERMWMWFGDTIANVPVAAVWASFWATCMALPFDNIKTKLQKQFSDPAKNRIHYNGFINCYRTTFIVEGWQGFIVGFYAFYFKILLLTLMTVYSSNIVMGNWKRKAGLPEYKI